MGGFWPRIYVVKKGYARDIYFLLISGEANGWFLANDLRLGPMI
jgi:hypothetical protein